ncbi:MAG: hypothetical protein QF682_10915 [Candidatus Thermoplasmatota archaeon]|nr:hypothetical protein [Candidatus Thermoplasmatota archaeon]
MCSRHIEVFSLIILDDPDCSSGMTGLDESINSSDLPRRYLKSRVLLARLESVASQQGRLYLASHYLSCFAELWTRRCLKNEFFCTLIESLILCRAQLYL